MTAKRLTKEQLDEYIRRGGTIHFNAVSGTHTKPERTRQNALGKKALNRKVLVDPHCTLRVRITRHISGRGRLYDDDNYINGCKALRDAIAAAFGRKGDSEADGFEWEYHQVKDAEQGKAEVEVQVFRKGA